METPYKSTAFQLYKYSNPLYISCQFMHICINIKNGGQKNSYPTGIIG